MEKNKNLIPAVIATVIAIIALVITSSLTSGGFKGPSKTAYAFAKAVADGNFDKAQKYMSYNLDDLMSDLGFGSKKINSEYVKELIGFEGIDGIKEILVSDPVYDKEDENEARVSVTILFEDGTADTESLNLTKASGSWLVEIL